MTLRERQSVFAFNIHLLIAYAFEIGYELTFGEGYRPEILQRIYVETGKSLTMHSRHLIRLAVDFNLFKDGNILNQPIDFKPLGDYWESLHPDNRWGGDWDRDENLLDETFKDPYHFEMRPAA
jgi:hypothetical protein